MLQTRFQGHRPFSSGEENGGRQPYWSCGPDILNKHLSLLCMYARRNLALINWPSGFLVENWK